MEGAKSQQLLIGLGVGVTSMVVFTGIMFLILVFRRRYLHKDDKYLKRVEWANGPHSPGAIDMTRSVAWSHRNGFRSSEGGGTRGGPALADSPYDPTLRPLHGQNAPFFHRDRQAQNGYSHSGSPMGSYMGSYSDRSGNIAIVPFRESNLPTADASYDVDGRIRVPNGHVRGAPGVGGRREEFPGSRPHHTRRNPVESSSLGFDDELFELAAGRRPPVGRDFNRDVPNWRRDFDNPWVENTRSSSADTSTENAPLQGRRGPPGGPPTEQNFNFSRDSSHLQEVYY